MTLPEGQNIDVRLFAKMLDYSTQSASYKPLWLIGILEEVKKGNQKIDFRTIGCHMISKAWYPILHCRLSFGSQDSLPKIVTNLSVKLAIKPDEKVNSIFNILMAIEEKELLKEIRILFEQVPYRILSPFYKIIDKNFNKEMREKTSADNQAFYQFVEDGKTIWIGQSWFEYMSANQVIIEAWIEYSMIYYLQKKNPNVPAIPLKIKPPDKRDLNHATKLWKYYGTYRPLRDIYINKAFNEDTIEQYGSLSLDHFLPWSFVLHDEVWNLLPSFKNINSSKNNDLPSLGVYLKDYCNLQYNLFSFIRDFSHQGRQIKEMQKIMEDYLHIMPISKTNESRLETLEEQERAWYQIGEDKFKDCLRGTIEPLYQIAYNQGYGIWICKDRQINYESSNEVGKNHLSTHYPEEIAEAYEENYLSNHK